MNKRLILENKIAVVYIGWLAVGGIYGVCAGAWRHVATICACLLVIWGLWRETTELNQ